MNSRAEDNSLWQGLELAFARDSLVGILNHAPGATTKKWLVQLDPGSVRQRLDFLKTLSTIPGKSKGKAHILWRQLYKK